MMQRRSEEKKCFLLLDLMLLHNYDNSKSFVVFYFASFFVWANEKKMGKNNSHDN